MKKGLRMNRLVCLLGFLCLLALAGCAGKHAAEERLADQGQSGDAEVVFIRPSL